MTAGEVAGAVAAVWRFPVKSMRGELLEAAKIEREGVLGDRAYALLDVETGKVVSAKSARRFPDMLRCSATFLEPPRSNSEPPPVRIALPDGTTVSSDDRDADRILTGFFAHQVRLIRSAPEDFTVDQYHPDIESVDPRGHRDVVVEQKLGAALFAELGLPPAVRAGSFLDVFPVSVLTTSMLARLQELRPASKFDARRFRMNVIVDTPQAGFVENDWIGRRIQIGDTVCLELDLPDPRCVMTTLAQDELPADPHVLRTLAQHNRLDVGAAGTFPCAGVYAVVEGAGTVRTGDPVLFY